MDVSKLKRHMRKSVLICGDLAVSRFHLHEFFGLEIDGVVGFAVNVETDL